MKNIHVFVSLCHSQCSVHCYCRNENAKCARPAYNSFFSLFPFLIFRWLHSLFPFSKQRIGRKPKCLLFNASLKYINKPRCNRIICLHMNRDNGTDEKLRHAKVNGWGVGRPRVRAIARPTAHGYLFVCKRCTHSVHVKIFDMSDAVLWGELLFTSNHTYHQHHHRHRHRCRHGIIIATGMLNS